MPTISVRLYRPKERTSVVASNFADALQHPSLPAIGTVKNGWKLIAKYASPVPGYRKWYVVELEWKRWKYSWIRYRKASAQKSESK